MHSNSDSQRSASSARDVSRIGPATDCETVRNDGLLWGEKPLVNELSRLNLTGWGERRIKLIIRRSQVQVLPAPPICLRFRAFAGLTDRLRGVPAAQGGAGGRCRRNGA